MSNPVLAVVLIAASLYITLLAVRPLPVLASTAVVGAAWLYNRLMWGRPRQ